VLCTLAAYAFARYAFIGSNIFALVLARLMIMPDVLIGELSHHEPHGHHRHHPGDRAAVRRVGVRHLFYRTFKTVPKGSMTPRGSKAQRRCRCCLVYVPLAKPIYVAYGLVSVSYHWNNFLWPLIVTSSVGRARSPSGCRCSRQATRASTGGDLRRHLDDPHRCCLGSAVPAPVRGKLHARGN
jgi:sn-glycerol 3-phosphate transport system permease protein